MLLSKKSKLTTAVNLAGDIELAVSVFMSTIDNRLSPAFPRKGNAPVTFDDLSLPKAGSRVCRYHSFRNKAHRSRYDCVESAAGKMATQKKARVALFDPDSVHPPTGRHLWGNAQSSQAGARQSRKTERHQSDSLVL